MLDKPQSDLVAEWKECRDTFEYYKEKEQNYRARIGMLVFPDAKSGAETKELGAGYRITYTPKTNYTLKPPADGPADCKIVDAMTMLADEMRLASNEGAFIFERLVSWKPSLSVAEYKRLSPELRKIVDRYVTTSEGAPSISIKEPAAAKGK